MRMKSLGSADNADPIPGKAAPASCIKRYLQLLVVLLPLFSPGVAGTASVQPNDDEYQVKAVFLFHFAQLVSWLADKLTVADNSLYLFTFGEDPFQGELESTIAGKAIGNRVIRILHFKEMGNMQ